MEDDLAPVGPGQAGGLAPADKTDTELEKFVSALDGMYKATEGDVAEFPATVKRFDLSFIDKADTLASLGFDESNPEVQELKKVMHELHRTPTERSVKVDSRFHQRVAKAKKYVDDLVAHMHSRLGDASTAVDQDLAASLAIGDTLQDAPAERDIDKSTGRLDPRLAGVLAGLSPSPENASRSSSSTIRQAGQLMSKRSLTKEDLSQLNQLRDVLVDEITHATDEITSGGKGYEFELGRGDAFATYTAQLRKKRGNEEAIFGKRPTDPDEARQYDQDKMEFLAKLKTLDKMSQALDDAEAGGSSRSRSSSSSAAMTGPVDELEEYKKRVGGRVSPFELRGHRLRTESRLGGHDTFANTRVEEWGPTLSAVRGRKGEPGTYLDDFETFKNIVRELAKTRATTLTADKARSIGLAVRKNARAADTVQSKYQPTSSLWKWPKSATGAKVGTKNTGKKELEGPLIQYYRTAQGQSGGKLRPLGELLMYMKPERRLEPKDFPEKKVPKWMEDMSNDDMSLLEDFLDDTYGYGNETYGYSGRSKGKILTVHSRMEKYLEKFGDDEDRRKVADRKKLGFKGEYMYKMIHEINRENASYFATLLRHLDKVSGKLPKGQARALRGLVKLRHYKNTKVKQEPKEEADEKADKEEKAQEPPPTRRMSPLVASNVMQLDDDGVVLHKTIASRTKSTPPPLQTVEETEEEFLQEHFGSVSPRSKARVSHAVSELEKKYTNAVPFEDQVQEETDFLVQQWRTDTGKTGGWEDLVNSDSSSWGDSFTWDTIDTLERFYAKNPFLSPQSRSQTRSRSLSRTPTMTLGPTPMPAPQMPRMMGGATAVSPSVSKPVARRPVAGASGIVPSTHPLGGASAPLPSRSRAGLVRRMGAARAAHRAAFRARAPVNNFRRQQSLFAQSSATGLTEHTSYTHLIEGDLAPVGRVHLVSLGPDVGDQREQHFLSQMDADSNMGAQNLRMSSRRGPFKNRSGRSRVMDQSAHVSYRRRGHAIEITVRRGITESEMENLLGKLAAHRMASSRSDVFYISGSKKKIGSLDRVDLEKLRDKIYQDLSQKRTVGILVHDIHTKGLLHKGFSHGMDFKRMNRKLRKGLLAN